MTIKIVSWNVNSIKARLHSVIPYLEEYRPAILLLQELKSTDETFPHEAFDHLGYNICTYGQKSYNGVAVFSQSPIDILHRGIPGFHDDQARYLEVFTCGLTVASVYVPNGESVDSEKYSYKLRFLDALVIHGLQSLRENKPVIWGGDFNIAPYIGDSFDEKALEDGRIMCSFEERNRLKILHHQGWIDCLYRLGKQDFTWWDYRAGSFDQNKGYRIDHMLATPQSADSIVNCGVDVGPRSDEKPSDHCPIWIELKDDDVQRMD
jgi:exodeoxyribonuclease-3